MKQKLLTLALCTICITCFDSCKDKKELFSKEDLEMLKKSEPEFDSERQCIYFKERRDYDINANIDVPFNINSPNDYNLACRLSFFNYGEDICLFNVCGDDLFITGVGTINYAYVLGKKDNIDIASKHHNEKYGDWALVNISYENNYVNNVFMTPLAMKAYKDGDDESYIFIQFVANDKYMNVLFYGGLIECKIIKYCPNVIIPRSDPSLNIDMPKSGPGQFWHRMNMSAEG